MGDAALASQDLGVVKWFGGFNNKTNRENHFGFIESIRGEEVFVHKSGLVNLERLSEGDKVSFSVAAGAKGPQATQVREFSAENEGVFDLLSVLKSAEADHSREIYFNFLQDLERFFHSASEDNKSEIALALFDDAAGRALIRAFRNSTEVYQQILLSVSFLGFVEKGAALESLPSKLIKENEETICRLICDGSISTASHSFVSSAPQAILYACGLMGLIDERTLQKRGNELRAYLRKKFSNPDGIEALLYKDIFATCIQRIGGYTESPVIWDMISELLLKKYLYERNFAKAIQLFRSNAGLERKIDCFILYNLAQLLAAGNNLQTTYQVFVHSLWQALANKQIDVEAQAGRILSLFPSCGTMKRAIAAEPSLEQEQWNGRAFAEDLRNASYERDLSCEAVYWEKQDTYLCRGSLCLSPQIRPNLDRRYLDFSIYDWFVHFGVEFWGSEDHQLRDFPVKLGGYLNRLREIMPRLRCRSCCELMVPDFRYSRVKCTVYEDGEWVQKDMAAAYRNTIFYCNNESCREHSVKHYINHCLGNLCYDLIDSRDLTIKCDTGRLICKGCASCCGEHGKSNPVGFCPECGAHLQLFEDPNQVSRFGRPLRFVQCSNQACGFRIFEPGLPKKFYLESCQPVHQAMGYV